MERRYCRGGGGRQLMEGRYWREAVNGGAVLGGGSKLRGGIRGGSKLRGGIRGGGQ